MGLKMTKCPKGRVQKKSDIYHFSRGGVSGGQLSLFFSLSRNDFYAILDHKNFSCIGGYPLPKVPLAPPGVPSATYDGVCL